MMVVIAGSWEASLTGKPKKEIASSRTTRTDECEIVQTMDQANRAFWHFAKRIVSAHKTTGMEDGAIGIDWHNR